MKETDELLMIMIVRVSVEIEVYVGESIWAFREKITPFGSKVYIFRQRLYRQATNHVNKKTTQPTSCLSVCDKPDIKNLCQFPFLLPILYENENNEIHWNQYPFLFTKLSGSKRTKNILWLWHTLPSWLIHTKWENAGL